MTTYEYFPAPFASLYKNIGTHCLQEYISLQTNLVTKKLHVSRHTLSPGASLSPSIHCFQEHVCLQVNIVSMNVYVSRLTLIQCSRISQVYIASVYRNISWCPLSPRPCLYCSYGDGGYVFDSLMTHTIVLHPVLTLQSDILL